MAAAAIPAITKVGSMVGGSIVGKLLSRPSKTARTAMTGAATSAQQMQDLSPQLMQQGRSMFQQAGTQAGRAGDAMGQAGNYYGRILGGDRGEMRSALAPEMRTITDYYKGARGKVDRTMRGGSRDMAKAELDRERVGNLAMMIPGARQNAAAGMERVSSGYGNLASSMMGGGSALTGQGVNAAANAGYINNMLFNQDRQVQGDARETGKGVGSMIYDIATSGIFGPKKPSLGGLFTPTVPGMGSGVYGTRVS